MRFYDNPYQLRVVIGASAAGDSYVQCVGVVEYEAQVAFEYDYPREVIVERPDGTELARATAP